MQSERERKGLVSLTIDLINSIDFFHSELILIKFEFFLIISNNTYILKVRIRDLQHDIRIKSFRIVYYIY